MPSTRWDYNESGKLPQSLLASPQHSRTEQAALTGARQTPAHPRLTGPGVQDLSRAKLSREARQIDLSIQMSDSSGSASEHSGALNS